MLARQTVKLREREKTSGERPRHVPGRWLRLDSLDWTWISRDVPLPVGGTRDRDHSVAGYYEARWHAVAWDEPAALSHSRAIRGRADVSEDALARGVSDLPEAGVFALELLVTVS